MGKPVRYHRYFGVEGDGNRKYPHGKRGTPDLRKKGGKKTDTQKRNKAFWQLMSWSPGRRVGKSVGFGSEESEISKKKGKEEKKREMVNKHKPANLLDILRKIAKEGNAKNKGNYRR